MKPTNIKINGSTYEVEKYENDLFFACGEVTLVMPDGNQKFRDLAIQECSEVMIGEDGRELSFDEDTVEEYMHTYMQQFVDENLNAIVPHVD